MGQHTYQLAPAGLVRHRWVRVIDVPQPGTHPNDLGEFFGKETFVSSWDGLISNSSMITSNLKKSHLKFISNWSHLNISSPSKKTPVKQKVCSSPSVLETCWSGKSTCQSRPVTSCARFHSTWIQMKRWWFDKLKHLVVIWRCWDDVS